MNAILSASLGRHSASASRAVGSIVLSVLITVSPTSCQRERPPEPVIAGEVLDSFGQPIAGATVAIRDSAFHAVTDSRGTFSLAFAPGSFHLTIAAPGHERRERDLNVTQSVRYPLGQTVLVRLPSSPPEAIEVAGARGYQSLPEVLLERRITSFGPSEFNRCVEFHLHGELPTLRGTTLAATFPGPGFLLTGLTDGGRVTSDEPPAIVGHCPGPTRAVPLTSRSLGDRHLITAEGLSSGRYCFLIQQRFNPFATGQDHAWCFVWVQDPAVRWGAILTEADDVMQRCAMDDDGRIPCDIPECRARFGYFGTLEETRRRGVCQAEQR